MPKNTIIAALAISNLILMAALIYMGVKGNEPAKAPMNATANTPLDQTGAQTEVGPQEFTYKDPIRLGAANAPGIVNRALALVATFDTQDQDGVIFAQGGLENGYALYVQHGELLFALRRFKVLTVVSGGTVGAGQHTITVTLDKAGQITIARDGSTLGTGSTVGMFTEQPRDGLDVGADHGAPVGRYKTPNSFGGRIEIITLKTTP